MEHTTIQKTSSPSGTNTHRLGYKHTPLGWIPEEWEVKPLQQLGTFSKGKGITKEQLTANGLACIRYGEIYTNYNYIISDFKSFISKETAKDSKEIKKGDVLFAGSGETTEEIGKAVAYTQDKKAFAGGDIIILSTHDKTTAEFISYVMETTTAQRQKRVLGQGNSVVHIYMSDLSKLEIPFPPIDQQQKIAAILSTWDDAIQKTQQLIAQLKLRNKGLMQHLLTGKKRLKGFSGKWKQVHLGDVTTKISRRNNQLLSATVYSVTNTNGFVPQSDHFEREIAGGDLSNYKIIKKNEFAYNPARINVGSIAYFTKEVGIISSLYVCFKNQKELLDSYLWYLLDLDSFKHKINSFGEGGVRIYLWYELFAQIKILLPSIVEQQAIINILTEADNELKLYEQQLTTLQQQKKGLMQKLLIGEVRVKV